MPHETTCIHCGTQLRVNAETLGRSATCRKCGKAFTVLETDAGLPTDYMACFSAVRDELTALFGETNGTVSFSPVPIYVDPQRGIAESLCFERYVPGHAYCTCFALRYSRSVESLYQARSAVKEPATQDGIGRGSQVGPPTHLIGQSPASSLREADTWTLGRPDSRK